MLRFFRSKRFASLVVRIALAVGLVVALESRDLFIGGAAALIVYGLGNSLAVFATPVDYTFHATTLSVPEILDDLIEAFVQTFPILTTMGLDLRGETLKKGKKEIAHITNVPTVSSFNAGAGGYGNGAQSARSLLIDVPVTPTDHPTCPIYWEHLDQISDDKVKYDDVIRLTAYALAKDVIDKILVAVNTRNFSKEIAIAIADFDYDALGLITEKANPQKMAPTGRSLIVCSRVATVLDADPRIITKTAHGVVGSEQIVVWYTPGGSFRWHTFGPAQYTVVDADTIDLLGVNWGGEVDALARFYRDYKPGTNLVRFRETWDFYLPGAAGQPATEDDIPAIATAVNDAALLALVVAYTSGYQVYDAEPLDNNWPFADSPVFRRITRELDMASL